MHQAHDGRDSFLAGGRPLGVVPACDVLADAQDVGDVGHGAAAGQDVGGQGVAETVGVGTNDFLLGRAGGRTAWTPRSFGVFRHGSVSARFTQRAPAADESGTIPLWANECTWNFAHLNNPFTRIVVREIVQNEGYLCPEICSPEELLEVDQ